jgi:hypothetical protein
MRGVDEGRTRKSQGTNSECFINLRLIKFARLDVSSYINRQPSTVNRQPSTVNCQLPTVNRQLPTVNRQCKPDAKEFFPVHLKCFQFHKNSVCENFPGDSDSGYWIIRL